MKKRDAIILPLVKALPGAPALNRDTFLRWLTAEESTADAAYNNRLNDNADRNYWAGYADALTNVRQHLTGRGE